MRITRLRNASAGSGSSHSAVPVVPTNEPIAYLLSPAADFITGQVLAEPEAIDMADAAARVLITTVPFGQHSSEALYWLRAAGIV